MRIGSLQWAVGGFCTLMGALLLVAPHQFGAVADTASQPIGPWWGVGFIVAGAALMAVAALAPPRWLAVAAHLGMGGMLLLLTWAWADDGLPTAVSAGAVLGIGTALAPFLARPRGRSAERDGDLFAALIGLSAALSGLVMLAWPDLFSASAYDLGRASLRWRGVAFLGPGLLLALTQFHPALSGTLARVAHLLLATVFLAVLLAVALPTGIWLAIAYYGGFGAALALLPWLGPLLRRLDLASLRLQLALALAAAAALPVFLAAALVADQEQRSVTADALAQQQAMASGLAQDLVDHLGLQRAAVAALAAQPGLAALTPEVQRVLLQAVGQANPDFIAFFTYNVMGAPIARSGDQPFVSAASLPVFQQVGRTNGPALGVHVSPSLHRPVFAFGAPIHDSSGLFAGVVVGVVEAQRVALFLARQAIGPSSQVYLVDDGGRTIAHPDAALVVSSADLSATPPVAALLASDEASGALSYLGRAGERLAGYARVAGLGWGVVVERPTDAALASVRAGRERVFWVLLLAIVGVAIVGALTATWLTAPLGALARAAHQLATGGAVPPLPRSRFTELAHLSTAFGQMRDRLAAHTAELERAEARFRGLVETAPDAIVTADHDGRIVLVNARAEQLFGYQRQELLDQPIELLVPERFRDLHASHRAAYAAAPHPRSGGPGREHLGRRKDGREFLAEISLRPLETEDGLLVTSVIHDLTGRKQAEEERAQLIREQAARAEAEAAAAALRQANQQLVLATAQAQAFAQEARAAEDRYRTAEAMFRGLVETAPDAIVTVDGDGRIVLANAQAEQLFGYQRAELLGQPVEVLLPERLRDAHARARAAYASAPHTRPMGVGIESIGQRKDGSEFPAEISLSPLETEDGMLVVSVIHDVTDRKRTQAALTHQALHDPLTGLPNRMLLSDRLRQAILVAHRENSPLALLLMDLDRFKEVNDTFGHPTGDLLLQQAGQRVQSILRASDTVARLGGDEFAVILPGADAQGGAVTAGKLQRALEQPFVVEGHDLEVGASLGLALYPEHGQDVETLLRRADIAMYAAKRAGSGYALYAFDQDRPGADHLAPVGELRQAIEQAELLLHYQPRVDLRSGRVVGVAALVRWQHPQRGLLPPDQFIPLAEQTGLIHPLTHWAIQAALGQCQAWRQAGLELPVAVNLSARNLHDLHLPGALAAALEHEGLPPACLGVEITEQAVQPDPERAVQILTHLRALGVRVTLDDFGAGASSLGALKKLPLDELKIAPALVQDLALGQSDATVVRAIVELGHDLGLVVVAGGVEDRATWEALAGLGCDAAQGSYLGRPLLAEELLQWLNEAQRGLSCT